MRKTDRRVERTKRMLKEALFELILEKGYDSVTIEDITNRADLGRTTFYLHYHDKEQLLLESIDTIAEELITQIYPLIFQKSSEELSTIKTNIDIQTPVLEVFNHASENANLYRIILRGEGAYTVSSRFHQIINMTVLEILKSRMAELEIKDISLQLDLISNFFAGALLSLLTWWLENNMPYPPEEMAYTFRRLIFEGLLAQFRAGNTK